MLHSCRQCGLVQVLPRPTLEALASYYAEDYRKGICAGADVTDLARFPLDNLYYYNRGQSINELATSYISENGKRILDIGPGFGHVIHALGVHLGSDQLTAIEFSEICVEHLESVGIRVFNNSADEILPDLDEEFDVIVLSHSLEHLLDPLGMLRLIAGRLATHGILIVEVPHIPSDSLERYPDHLWAPRFDEPHITFFSQDTLVGILREAGLQVRFCDTAGPTYRYIAGWRYRLPTLRWWIQDLVPHRLFLTLRDLSATEALRMKTREEAFFRYGGNRIWLRSIAGRRAPS